MGATNIHHGQQILQRAGRDLADQAVIAYFNKGVLLVGRGFHQEEVDDFANALHTKHRNKWVEYNGIDSPKPVASDKNVSIPTLYTSPGLSDDSRRYQVLDMQQDAGGKGIDLVFVLIVQGASGSLFAKTRVFYSYFAVAAGITEEALQGMNVVFSAAMLKQDVKRLGTGVPFLKVDNLKELLAGALVAVTDGGKEEILLFC